MNFSIFTLFLKNRNIIFKMKISKVTDYAALSVDFNWKSNDNVFFLLKQPRFSTIYLIIMWTHADRNMWTHTDNHWSKSEQMIKCD